jgi:hypothetical protein
MPKKISLTPEQEGLMQSLFSAVPTDIGHSLRRPKNSIKPILIRLREAGVSLCEDTIRRYAVKRGYMVPVGAKYIPSPPKNQWHRPCMICKTTNARPKGQYICTPCQGREYA